jgi:5'-3' exonuclease
VPGEGEHKILDFIRSQRAQKAYDVNTSHCIYGADADLIMLGLSTHEPHFYILRESVEQDSTQQNNRRGQGGKRDCHGIPITVEAVKKAPTGVKFQYVKISVVREYLYLEFKDL